MKPHLHACLWLGLLALGACNKAKQSGASPEDHAAGPRVTRTNRPPLDDRPDPRKKLRADLASAAAMESPAGRETAIAKAAWDALELDPELAREAMGKLTPDSAERIRLIQHLAMRMAENDVEQALRWADSLGTENEKSAAFGHIALVLSDTDPERAAGLLSESGVEGRAFDVVAVQVLVRWAARSPADAAAWVEMFPAGESREAGMRSVVSLWAEKDAAALVSWMGGMQDETIRREAALAMAMALLRQPEDLREEWLGHADEALRGDIQSQWEAAKKETGRDDRSPGDQNHNR